MEFSHINMCTLFIKIAVTGNDRCLKFGSHKGFYMNKITG